MIFAGNACIMGIKHGQVAGTPFRHIHPRKSLGFARYMSCPP